MKLSPIYGFPIAEPTDFTAEYPIQVDDPKTLAIEKELYTAAVVEWEYGGVSIPSGPVSVAAPPSYWEVSNSDELTIDPTTGHILNVSAGIFQISFLVDLNTPSPWAWVQQTGGPTSRCLYSSYVAGNPAGITLNGACEGFSWPANNSFSIGIDNSGGAGTIIGAALSIRRIGPPMGAQTTNRSMNYGLRRR